MVSTPIRAEDGTEVGRLVIQPVLSNRGVTGALELGESKPGSDPTIQLLEDCEYWYQVDLQPPSECRTDRDDIFIWDPGGSTGHLRPGSHVGYLPVTILVDSRPVGVVEVEIRSRKLGYVTDYRVMLRDIACASALLVMERFATTQQHFKPRGIAGITTPYSRFEFLKSVVSPEVLGAAIEQIQRRPHRTWRQEQELGAAARGLIGGQSHLRDLLKAGPRVPWPRSPVPGLTSVPRHVPVRRAHATHDTQPNRFIKFALKRWRSEVRDLQIACARELRGHPRMRAIRETEDVLEWLDSALAWPMFSEVGELDQFPYSDTVLLRREGYREIFEAFGLFELVAELEWDGGDYVYRAGQRDVATLYEYWCFLQLATLVTELCGGKVESSLVVMDSRGASLGLRRGRESVVSGSILRLGRRLDLALHFNREFAMGAGGDQSWTRAMRPDCSLRISSSDDVEDDAVWVHFDAKYKIEQADQIFVDVRGDASAEEPAEQDQTARAKRDDLLKMHAYRDAIRRSSGSYVLYPGPANERVQRFSRFNEILPGIGAFALRPSESGDAHGLPMVRRFLDDIVVHHASLITQQRRGRYWEGVSFATSTVPSGVSGWQPERRQPAADTPVLLGYVRSVQHLNWVLEQGRYNLRLGRRRGSVGLEGIEADAELLILYGESLPEPRMFTLKRPPEIWLRGDLDATNYPNAGGSAYFCVVLGHELDASDASPRLAERVRRLAGSGGAPKMTTWLQVALL